MSAKDHNNNWGRWGDDDERGALNLLTRRRREARRGGDHHRQGLPARHPDPGRGRAQLRLPRHADAPHAGGQHRRRRLRGVRLRAGYRCARGRAGLRVARHVAHGRVDPRLRRPPALQRRAARRHARDDRRDASSASRRCGGFAVARCCSTSSATSTKARGSPGRKSRAPISKARVTRRASRSGPATSCCCASATSTCGGRRTARWASARPASASTPPNGSPRRTSSRSAATTPRSRWCRSTTTTSSRVHKVLLVRHGIYLLEFLEPLRPARDECWKGSCRSRRSKVTGATGSPINPIFVG